MSTSLNEKSNVLIVDDDAITATLLAEIIGDLYINIITVNSGYNAIEIAKKNDLSVILLDLRMPEMDGYEVLEQLRKIKKHELTPVIIISANYAEPDTIVKIIEKGAIDFIPKPINHKILYAKVNQFVKLDQYQRKSEQLVRQLEESTVRVKESENRFKKISYTANDSIIVLDTDFKIKFWNRASKNIFGYSKIEIREEVIFDYIISDKNIEYLKLKLLNILNSNPNIFQKTEEVSVIHKSGYEFFVEMSFSSFKTRDEGLNIVVVSRDISMRMKLEKNLLKAKELKEANKTMKEFVDNISHELRTPMNAIIGISKMLLKYESNNLSKKQFEGLTIISNNGDKLLELINDILDLSKLDSGKNVLNNELFSLEKLLSNIRSLIINLIGTKDIKFVIRKSRSVPDTIFSDQKKITQILLNLLGNSVKFTEKGKIVLSLHLREKELCFEIYDTGCGIPKNKINTVFDRFSQVDNSNKKKYQGTGLGLNIVKKMVQLFQGEITIESIPDKETTVFFTLMLNQIPNENKTQQSDQIKQDPIKVKENKLFPNENKLLALIIDDNKDNVVYYSKWFDQAGYAVFISEDGVDGYEKIETYRPDIVLLNMEVKKFSAYAILRNLLNDEYLTETCVLAISDKLEYLKQDFLNSRSKFLQEPISEKDLINFIRSETLKNKIERTKISILENSNKKIVFTDISSKYNFNVTSLEQAKYIYYRRNSEIIILNGIAPTSINYQLIEALCKDADINTYKPLIIYVSDKYLNHSSESTAFKDCIFMPESLFSQPISFSFLVNKIKSTQNE